MSAAVIYPRMTVVGCGLIGSSVIRAARQAGAVGEVIVADASEAHRARIVELALRSRVPSVFGGREYVAIGGLMSYLSPGTWHWRSAARFVDKILKGAKPADLPVEEPTQFELIINLKTAKQLGLIIPQSVLQRADELIQ